MIVDESVSMDGPVAWLGDGRRIHRGEPVEVSGDGLETSLVQGVIDVALREGLNGLHTR